MICEIYCSGPALTNCVLLGCEKTRIGAIIDAPFESGEHLLKREELLELKIDKLLLTHSHWDHTGNAHFLKKKLGIPVYVHELDAPNLRKAGSDGLPLMMDVEPVEPDHFLKDGDRIPVGELILEVIHTPGHTPGGVCFYIESEKLLISGDTLFQGTIGNLSFPTAEPEKMWSSLDRLAKLSPETRVIPGHGDETHIGDETWLANARQHFGG